MSQDIGFVALATGLQYLQYQTERFLFDEVIDKISGFKLGVAAT